MYDEACDYTEHDEHVTMVCILVPGHTGEHELYVGC